MNLQLHIAHVYVLVDLAVVKRRMATLRREAISPGLLANINWDCEVPEELKLVVSGWQDSDYDEENSPPSDASPPAKKRRKTLKLPKPTASGQGRYSETVSEEQLAVLSNGFVPANTSKNTKWAVNAFETWVESRNSRVKDTIDKNILSSSPVDKEELCRCLSLFVVQPPVNVGSLLFFTATPSHSYKRRVLLLT